MGQQQLLLIVIGVIIVGIAILMGIVLYRSHAIQTKKESITNDCASIANLAQKYYWTPKPMGGGGKSFEGFVIPVDMDSTANGRYELNNLQAQQLDIDATGNEIVVNGDSVRVTMRVLAKNFFIVN